MTDLSVTAGAITFDAKFEAAAPKTVTAFRAAMPFVGKLVHVCWSGEGVGIPLGDHNFDVSYEKHTSHPAPGQITLYPRGISETEILMASGCVDFASNMGQLEGNHFFALTSGHDHLRCLGNAVLSQEVHDIRFDRT
jgi:hypothetical protein